MTSSWEFYWSMWGAWISSHRVIHLNHHTHGWRFLCFVLVCIDLFYRYPLGWLYWHLGKHTIDTVLTRLNRRVLTDKSHSDQCNVSKARQGIIKACSNFTGYTPCKKPVPGGGGGCDINASTIHVLSPRYMVCTDQFTHVLQGYYIIRSALRLSQYQWSNLKIYR